MLFGVVFSGVKVAKFGYIPLDLPSIPWCSPQDDWEQVFYVFTNKLETKGGSRSGGGNLGCIVGHGGRPF